MNRHCGQISLKALYLLRATIVFGILAVSGIATMADARDSDGTVAFAARLAGDDQTTRFVADLTGDVPVRAFALADPYRVIVDLPEVSFRLPAGAGEKGRGLVRAFRYGLFAPGKSRIVFDVAGPVVIDEAFVRSPEDGQPARLVVELKATNEETFRKRAQSTDGFPSSNAGAKRPRLPVSGVAAAADPGAKPLIVLDPGHGGIDPGATSRSGIKEKVLVLDFAKALKERLEKDGRFEVKMTREDDTFIALDDRVRMAREQQAALFISIHADSFRMRSIHGATIYTLSEKASDAQAAALADRENRADVVAGLNISDEPDAVTDILVDLVRRETKNLSILFARNAISELAEESDLNKNPHRHAGFRVLKAPDVPSVLIELGYLSNADDEKRLRDEGWRNAASEALARAISNYLEPRLAGTSR